MAQSAIEMTAALSFNSEVEDSTALEHAWRRLDEAVSKIRRQGSTSEEEDIQQRDQAMETLIGQLRDREQGYTTFAQHRERLSEISGKIMAIQADDWLIPELDVGFCMIMKRGRRQIIMHLSFHPICMR